MTIKKTIKSMENNFEINGVWYLPNFEANQIPGKITFSQEHGINLELHGHFKDFDQAFNESNNKIILGTLQNGKRLTLIENKISNQIFSFPGIPVIKYSSQFMLIGEHFKNKDNIMFNEITLEFNNINQWFNNTGIQINNKKTELNLNYNTPKEIEFKLNDYNANFEFYAITEVKNINSFLLKEKIDFKLKKEKKTPFVKLLQDSIVFQGFLTFATLESTFPIKIKLRDYNNFNIYQDCKLYNDIELYYRTNVNNNKKQKAFFELLFTFDDIKDNSEKIISNWYEHNQEFDPIINLFLNSIYSNNSFFSENNFLDIIHALETFHRRKFKNEVLPRHEYNERKKQILAAIPEEYNSWLATKLDFGNEPSLHDRLFELINSLSDLDIINKIIPNQIDFIKDTKNSRNYYTHYDKSLKKKALRGTDLYYLTMKLRIILIIHLLVSLGFEEEKINQITQRLKDHHFNYLFR